MPPCGTGLVPSVVDVVATQLSAPHDPFQMRPDWVCLGCDHLENTVFFFWFSVCVSLCVCPKGEHAHIRGSRPTKTPPQSTRKRQKEKKRHEKTTQRGRRTQMGQERETKRVKFWAVRWRAIWAVWRTVRATKTTNTHQLFEGNLNPPPPKQGVQTPFKPG